MDIATVGVIGAGTMGGGIAQNLVEHGLTAMVFDSTPGQVARAFDGIAAALARGVAKGRMKEAAAAAARARLIACDALDRVARCDLVIEAVFEDLAIKQALFRRLAPMLAKDNLVASNTSSLRIDELAAGVPGPERFLGLHYFSPAAVNRLVEVVRGAATSQRNYDRALAFARATGKEPLVCRDAHGFVVNRFFCPYLNEAARLLEDGYTTGAVDHVAREIFAAPLGPFAVMNITKPRIALHAQRTLGKLGAFYEPARVLVETGEADRAWTIAGDTPADSPARGVIARRLQGAVYLPVLQLIDEAVAAATAVDLGARVALRWDMQPCAAMDGDGAEVVRQTLEPVLKRYGVAPPRSLARVGRLLGPS